jgi:hypothetical protein
MRKQPRMTVEQCSHLRITDLLHAGLFRTKIGTWGSCCWTDQRGKRIRKIVFRLLKDSAADFVLQVRQDVGNALPTPLNVSEQMIRITSTRCHFSGKRHWLHCPNVKNGIPCGRRVGVLYLVPGGKVCACRFCLNLTYSSVRQHDSRLDKMVRLSYEQIMRILVSGSPTERLLASRAVSLIRRKYERKLAKFGRRPRSTA